MKFLRRLALILAVQPFLAAAEPPSWEDPQVFRVNKQEARATSMPFPSREGALGTARLESPWCVMLNGSWKFQWSGRPERAAGDFHREDFDDSGWVEIPVPANWQLHGHGAPL